MHDDIKTNPIIVTLKSRPPRKPLQQCNITRLSAYNRMFVLLMRLLITMALLFAWSTAAQRLSIGNYQL